jgi:hypothetical protein
MSHLLWLEKNTYNVSSTLSRSLEASLRGGQQCLTDFFDMDIIRAATTTKHI